MIRVHNLTKRFRVPVRTEGIAGTLRGLFRPEYRTVTALDSATFQIAPGEMVAYIGLNGAGKSTTMKLLSGILVPSEGEVEVAEMAPHRHRQRLAERIGLVFGQRSQLWWDLPVRESFWLLKRIYRVSDATYQQNLEAFHDLLGLREIWETPVRLLSLGQKMRADLCAAFLHNPAILFLDEPTIGLDVLVKEKIRRFLKAMNRERSTTVLLTTHDLRDVEEVCSRVILIDRGQIIYDGALVELLQSYAAANGEPANLETVIRRIYGGED
ncbi:MAG: ABC transporter ATP-binding protein [Bacillota bacterium]